MALMNVNGSIEFRSVHTYTTVDAVGQLTHDRAIGRLNDVGGAHRRRVHNGRWWHRLQNGGDMLGRWLL